MEKKESSLCETVREVNTTVLISQRCPLARIPRRESLGQRIPRGSGEKASRQLTAQRCRVQPPVSYSARCPASALSFCLCLSLSGAVTVSGSVSCLSLSVSVYVSVSFFCLSRSVSVYVSVTCPPPSVGKAPHPALLGTRCKSPCTRGGPVLDAVLTGRMRTVDGLGGRLGCRDRDEHCRVQPAATTITHDATKSTIRLNSNPGAPASLEGFHDRR